MKMKINTSKGVYKYDFYPVFFGVKRINKEIAKENLLLFNEIAKRNGLKYALAYGTLLGAMREHDFIAHDEDIDLYIVQEDVELLKSMLFELRDNGFEVIRHDRKEFMVSIMRKGEYIDFYGFHPSQGQLWRCISLCMPERYLTNWDYIDFLGEKFLAPQPAEECLLFLFGENWRTPIQDYDYEQSWLKKKLAVLKWYAYYKVPDFIFDRYMKKRSLKHVKYYNKRVNRINKILGKELFKCIDLNHIVE